MGERWRYHRRYLGSYETLRTGLDYRGLKNTAVVQRYRGTTAVTYHGIHKKIVPLPYTVLIKLVLR